MRTAALVAGVVVLFPSPTFAAEPPVITSGPQGTIQVDSATFTFTSTAADVECSVDGAPFVACTSPFTITGLANGMHSLAVRGVGDLAPAIASWSVLVPKVLPIVIPARVVGVEVQREPNKAVITWRPVYGATAYRVQVGTKTTTVHRPRLTLGNLRPGKKYRVSIVATNRYGSSPMEPLTIKRYHKH